MKILDLVDRHRNMPRQRFVEHHFPAKGSPTFFATERRVLVYIHRQHDFPVDINPQI